MLSLRCVQSALTLLATLAFSITLCILVSGHATRTDSNALFLMGARATLPAAFGLLTLTTRLAAMVWRGGESLSILLAKLNCLLLLIRVYLQWQALLMLAVILYIGTA